MLFQPLFGLSLVGEKVHSNAAGSNSQGAYKQRVTHFPCYTGWLIETMCFRSGGLHANCCSRRASSAAHPALQISYCEKMRWLSTLDSTFRLKHSLFYWNTQQMSKLAGKTTRLRDKGLLCRFKKGCSVPFLGSWWRSWNGHKSILLLEPGGQPSAPPLLP